MNYQLLFKEETKKNKILKEENESYAEQLKQLKTDKDQEDNVGNKDSNSQVELQKLQERVDELTSQVKGKDECIHDLESKLAQVEKELVEAQEKGQQSDESDKLQAENKNLKEEVADLELQVRNLQEKQKRDC